MNVYNNSYEYKWNNIEPGLKSSNSDSIFHYLNYINMLNYIIDNYMEIDKNSSLQLNLVLNKNQCFRLCCNLIDFYENEYGSKVRILYKPKDIFELLHLIEINTSGLMQDIIHIPSANIDFTKQICLKQKFINEVLKKVDNKTIENGKNIQNLVSKLSNFIVKNLNLFVNIRSIFNDKIYLNIKEIKGHIKEIDSLLKYLGIKYWLKDNDNIIRVYKIEDIKATENILKLQNL